MLVLSRPSELRSPDRSELLFWRPALPRQVFHFGPNILMHCWWFSAPETGKPFKSLRLKHDWKSQCRWFDSAPGHQRKQHVTGLAFNALAARTTVRTTFTCFRLLLMFPSTSQRANQVGQLNGSAGGILGSQSQRRRATQSWHGSGPNGEKLAFPICRGAACQRWGSWWNDHAGGREGKGASPPGGPRSSKDRLKYNGAYPLDRTNQQLRHRALTAESGWAP